MTIRISATRIKKIVKVYFIVTGMVLTLFLIWMATGLPILIDNFLVKSDSPIQGDAIVCIGGGLTEDNLPSEQGWSRIYASVQLYVDGYAPKIIFTGGGAAKITEAEIYAEAARWLGCPQDAIVIEPKANRTAEHPLNILKIKNMKISRDCPLNIVTSPLHSKRTFLCFKKNNFKNIQLITSYASKKLDSAIVRSLKRSQFDDFRPRGKTYNDIFFRLRWRIEYFFEAVRELAAIGAYKLKGYV